MQLGLGLVVLGGLAFLLLRKKDEPTSSTALPETSQTPTAPDDEVAAMIAGLTDAELTALATAGAAGEAIGGLTAEQVASILPAVQAELAKRTTVEVPVDPSAGKPAAETGVTDMRAREPAKKRKISPADLALTVRKINLNNMRRKMGGKGVDRCAGLVGQAAVACRAGRAQADLTSNTATVKVRF
jgi:hypothetical protein